MEAIGLNMAFLFPSPYALRSRGQKPRRRTVRGTPDPSIPVPEPDIHYAHFETLMRGYSTGSVVLRPLARQLGLPPRSLVALGVGYDERRQRWVFPERDWRGRLVGLVYRDFAGHRWCEDGSTRGLTIPADLDQTSGPIYLVEGASDTAGMHSVGAAATGRPTACASLLAKQWLTKFLQREPHRDVLVVGDRDPEREGRRTGEAGAVALAGHLETTLGRRVRWALPAPMFKDVRDQIVAGQWEQGLYWERES